MHNKTFLVLSDLLTFNLAFLFSYWLRIHSGIFSYSTVSLKDYFSLLLFGNLLFILVLLSYGLYKEKRGRFTTDEFINIFKSLLLVFIILTATTFLYKATIYSRLIITFTFVSSLLLITLVRTFMRKTTFFTTQKKTHVVIYKNDAIGQRLLTKLKEHPELNYNFLGFIKNLKEIQQFPQKIDVVFITAKPTSKQLSDIIMHNPNLEFKLIPDFLELITEPLNFEEFQDMPLITIPKQLTITTYSTLKRILDIIISFILLTLLSLIFVLIALLIKCTSKGPVIHTQLRVGKHETLFVFYKFRTMIQGMQDQREANEVSYLYKKKHDPRITFIGKILRRSCLDELPQLWNVFKGDMSLVGPRPHFKEELQALQGWQKKRFSVKPGMTGLWQVSGRHELSFEKTVFLDIYYVNHLSLALDLKIMFKTIPSIIFSGGRW